MNKNLLRFIFLLIVTLSIFYLIFTYINPVLIIQVLSKADSFYVLLSLSVFAIGMPIVVLRWQIILHNIGYSITFWRCFNIVMAALPLTSITPSKSGDMVRAYYVKDEIPMTKMIGTVFTERIFDLFSLLLLSIIGSIFYFRIELLIFFVVALFMFAVLMIIPSTNVRLPFIDDSWNDKLQNTMLSMKLLSSNRDAFLSVLSLSLVSWLLAVFQSMLFFYALKINVPFIFTMTNMPIAILIGLLPVTLGGMGTRDAAIIFLFSEYATPSELLGVGILFSFMRYWLASLIGIPFMRRMTNHE